MEDYHGYGCCQRGFDSCSTLGLDMYLTDACGEEVLGALRLLYPIAVSSAFYPTLSLS